MQDEETHVHRKRRQVFRLSKLRLEEFNRTRQLDELCLARTRIGNEVLLTISDRYEDRLYLQSSPQPLSA